MILHLSPMAISFRRSSCPSVNLKHWEHRHQYAGRFLPKERKLHCRERQPIWSQGDLLRELTMLITTEKYYISKGCPRWDTRELTRKQVAITQNKICYFCLKHGRRGENRGSMTEGFLDNFPKTSLAPIY